MHAVRTLGTVQSTRSAAETEKFPHVTFFFNDYREDPFDGERRILIQSPTDVATYDEKPENELQILLLLDRFKFRYLCGQIVCFTNGNATFR